MVINPPGIESVKKSSTKQKKYTLEIEHVATPKNGGGWKMSFHFKYIADLSKEIFEQLPQVKWAWVVLKNLHPPTYQQNAVFFGKCLSPKFSGRCLTT